MTYRRSCFRLLDGVPRVAGGVGPIGTTEQPNRVRLGASHRIDLDLTNLDETLVALQHV